jgi:uroporphyrinogen-III synthase
LNAQTIIVTRPAGQARQLIELLSAGIKNDALVKLGEQELPQILSLPLLTIVPKGGEPHDSQIDPLADHITTVLKDADLAIFVSPNAIECTMRLLGRAWQDFSKKIIPIGVMGGSSKLALQHHGIGLEEIPTMILLPKNNEHWDSEGLWKELQSLDWNWPERKVVIFKGEGGRDWLADTLVAAGATVQAISVYSRVPLDIDSPAWEAIHKIDFSQSLWLLTSSEAVRYLGEVIQDQFTQTLLYASAICPHQNIGEAAKAIGFGKVFICEPGDEALIKASQVWLSLN